MTCEVCGLEFQEDWRKDERNKKLSPIPKYCSRRCSAKAACKIAAITPRKHSAGKKRGPKKGTPSPKKGWSKETHPSVLATSEKLRGRPGTFLGRTHSKETREKLSLLQSKRIEEAGHGGFRDVLYYKVSNIKGKEYSVRGTWELKTAEYLNARGVLWERLKYLSYVDLGGVKRTYVPDFYLPESEEYWEVKGYFSAKDKLKMRLVNEQNGFEVKILQEHNLVELGIIAG
jgi:hypothetical protein